jgi:hypothetical protein
MFNKCYSIKVTKINKKRKKYMPDFNIKAMQEVIIVIGDSGGDGGAVIVTPHGLKKVPDNNPELRKAFKAIVDNYAILKRGVENQNITTRSM